MTPKQLTVTVIVATTAIIIGYDVWAVLAGGVESTISAVIFNASMRFPLIPFAFGVLAGHFWFPVYEKKDKQ
jgi:hypothetical protein